MDMCVRGIHCASDSVHMGRYFDCLKQMVRVNVGKQFCLAQDDQAPLNKQLLTRRCCKVSFTYKTRGEDYVYDSIQKHPGV
jgi:hypothetical protein